MADNNLPSSTAPQEITLYGDTAWLEDIKAKLESGAISEEQWKQVQWFFQENKFAPVQPSIICKDSDCPYFSACALRRANIPRPIGEVCPLEETTKQLWFQQLSKEVGVAEDGFEAMDLGAACDIINLLIQKQRIQWEMVKNPEVSVRTIVGMSPDGEPIVDMKANPTYFTLKALNQVQLKIMEGLLTTREARSKDQSRKTQDSAVRYSQIEAVAQRLKNMSGRNLDGSPMNVIDIVANLPEVKTSDELMNIDDEEPKPEPEKEPD